MTTPVDHTGHSGVNGDHLAGEAPTPKAVAVEIEFICEACGCPIDEPGRASVLQTGATAGDVVEVVHDRCVPEHAFTHGPRSEDGPVHQEYPRMFVGTLMEVLPEIVAGEYRLSTRVAPPKSLRNSVRVVGVLGR